jgi:hypothetical protein
MKNSKGVELSKYPLAYSGARTAKGGTGIGTSGCQAEGIKGLLVGDLVRYADGSNAVVTSGAGNACSEGNKSFAIVGSHISGGDHIVSSPVEGTVLWIDDDERPKGFLVEMWVSRG